MEITVMFIESLNALIRSAKRYQRENELHMYRQELNEAYGMIKGLFMMDIIDGNKFSYISDMLWRLTEVTEDDF